MPHWLIRSLNRSECNGLERIRLDLDKNSPSAQSGRSGFDLATLHELDTSNGLRIASAMDQVEALQGCVHGLLSMTAIVFKDASPDM